ncbi:Dolichol kinase [Trichinella spiralis]|uniref:dolichol kinase n=1 Tax=Trichinella spiralis TaxID=6334 RepID=A0A0V1B4H2_TRISP|nr:Dolichol kinase [Trichinella spiralis]KRY31951.1 Dolichol kinase [Trichinella spiralis]
MFSRNFCCRLRFVEYILAALLICGSGSFQQVIYAPILIIFYKMEQYVNAENILSHSNAMAYYLKNILNNARKTRGMGLWCCMILPLLIHIECAQLGNCSDWDGNGYFLLHTMMYAVFWASMAAYAMQCVQLWPVAIFCLSTFCSVSVGNIVVVVNLFFMNGIETIPDHFKLVTAPSSLWLGTVVYIVQALSLYNISRWFKRSFTIGELCLVYQLLFYGLFRAAAAITNVTAFENPLMLMPKWTMLWTAVVVLHILLFRSDEIFELVFLIILNFSLIAYCTSVQCTVGAVKHLMIRLLQQKYLFLFWSFNVWASGMFIRKCMKMNIPITTVHRKFFHLPVVMVAVSGLLVDPQLTYCVSALTFAFMVLIEAVRALSITSVGNRIHQVIKIFGDNQDQGKLFLTPLYLFVAIFWPIWWSPVTAVDEIQLRHFSGIISVGVGDAMAALVGSRFGRHRMSKNSSKSVEGLFANFISMILLLFVFAVILDEPLKKDPLFIIRAILGCAGVALFEARTGQMDNLILPPKTAFSISTPMDPSKQAKLSPVPSLLSLRIVETPPAIKLRYRDTSKYLIWPSHPLNVNSTAIQRRDFVGSQPAIASSLYKSNTLKISSKPPWLDPTNHHHHHRSFSGRFTSFRHTFSTGRSTSPASVPVIEVLPDSKRSAFPFFLEYRGKGSLTAHSPFGNNSILSWLHIFPHSLACYVGENECLLSVSCFDSSFLGWLVCLLPINRIVLITQYGH